MEWSNKNLDTNKINFLKQNEQGNEIKKNPWKRTQVEHLGNGYKLKKLENGMK